MTKKAKPSRRASRREELQAREALARLGGLRDPSLEDPVTRRLLAQGGLAAVRAACDGRLPPGTEPALRLGLKEIREARERRLPFGPTDPLTVMRVLRLRWETRLVETARQLLESCDYKRAAGKWAGGDHKTIVYFGYAGDAPWCKGMAEKVWGKKWGGRNSLHTVWINAREWWRLYRAGKATVQIKGKRYFVLGGEPDGPRLYAAPARGFGLKLTSTVVVRRAPHAARSERTENNGKR